jgi:glycogen(starch) synthase
MLSCARVSVRVLLWSELYWPHVGGAEVFARDLIAALSARGHSFAIVTSMTPEAAATEDVVDGVPVYRFPFRSWQGGRLEAFRASLSGVAALKSRLRPDLVHVNAVGPSALFHLRTRSSSAVPTLLTLQQQVLDSQSAGGDTLISELLRSAEWVVGCSTHALAHARQLVSELDGRSSTILNGIPAPTVTPAPLPLDPPRLLCLGRLVPAKGFDLAIAAFARIRERFPGVTLDIAGDGPERERLVAEAGRLRVSDAVRFHGWVEPSRVYDLINTATLLLMPSRREGLPIVSLQAAHMGRPIVGTFAGGLPEVVKHGETGWLCPIDDEGALTDALAAALSSPGALLRMSNTSAARARAEFDWHSTVGRYDELYRRLAEAERETEGAA